MTTVIIDVQGNKDALRVADALRLMHCVKRISIHEDGLERIPGLPYTQEELIESVLKSTEEYRNGSACLTQEEAKREVASW